MKKENYYFIEVLEDYEAYCFLCNSEELEELKKQDLKNTEIDELIIYKLCASGKSYQDRKNYVENIAITYSNRSGCNLSLNDLCILNDYFLKNGKRYGLIETFKENMII